MESRRPVWPAPSLLLEWYPEFFPGVKWLRLETDQVYPSVGGFKNDRS
jgi:hypothetical protein